MSWLTFSNYYSNNSLKKLQQIQNYTFDVCCHMCVTLAIQHSAAVLYGPKNLSLYPHANVTISVN